MTGKPAPSGERPSGPRGTGDDGSPSSTAGTGRSTFERLLIQLATDFINLPAAETDVGIQRALDGARAFTGDDGAYVFQVGADGVHGDLTHESLACDISTRRPAFTDFALDRVRVAADLLRAGNVVHVPSLRAVPETVPGRDYLLEVGVTSIIALPLRTDERFLGFVGFGNGGREKTWSDDSIALLQVLAGILVNALERRRTEETLRAQEQRFRTIVTEASDAIFLGTSDGRCLDANLQAAELLGYTLDELPGMMFTQFLPAEDPARAQLGLRRLRAGRIVRTERRLQRKDGTLVDVDFTARQLADGRLLAIVRDVTERKRTEQAVRESEERYRRLMEDAPLGVFAAAADGHILAVNAQLVRLLGAPSAESVLAKNAFTAPEFVENGLADLFRQCVARGEERRGNFTCTGWREPVHLRVHAAPLAAGTGMRAGFQCVVEDITDHARTEEALRQSERRWRSLVEQAPIGVLVCDRAGKAIEVNAYLLKRVGAPSLEVFAEHTNLLTNESLVEQGATAYMRRCIEHGESVAFDLSMQADFGEWGGNEIMFRCHVAPLRDVADRITGAVVVTEDVMARRQAEAALRESERSLAKAQEIAHLGNWTLDPGTGAIEWSAEVSRIAGRRPEDFTPTMAGLLRVAHPDDRRVLSDAVARIVRTGQPDRIEIRLRRPDGAKRWLDILGEAQHDASGTVTRIVGTVHDITNRKEAEANRVLLATAVEQAAEMILITDVGGRIEYVNPAFERITGYTREEAIGRNPRMLSSGRHDQAFYTDVWDTILRGEVWSGNFINRRKDGTEYEEESVISPVRDATGRVVHFVKVMRDVTQERKLEAQLRQAQKMEAIGTLASGIAHDFNNILTAIQGFTELAQQTVPDTSVTGRNLEEVLTASRRAKSLVAQILAFGRRSEAERQAFDIVPQVTEALRLMRAALPSTIDIRTDLGPSAVVYADASEMHQVFMNLAANAGQAMTGGGVLEFRVHLEEMDAAACEEREDLEPGPYVCITVRDTGCGMDAATVARVFEPYFSTKTVGEGTGLGLAVVHGIIKGLGGDIAVTSAPGRGTEFRLWLPEAGTAPAADEPVADAPEQGREHVLVVDDEPQVRTLIGRSLERLGYAVTTCADGTEALERLQTTPEAFALVVTDRTMPRMTGLELTEAIRRQWPELPVLFCTGLLDRSVADAATRAGATALVAKPLTGTELSRVIRRVLDGPAVNGTTPVP